MGGTGGTPRTPDIVCLTATCYGHCGDTQVNASAGVLVYRLPEQVVLEPVPALAVGESRNLTCHVLEVAPVGNLTVTLRRGAETLRTASFGAVNGSASVAVTHVLSAGPGDHRQDVTCHAELSLRPHGPLFARAAIPIRLSVFALPEPPQLQAPSRLELGTTSTATCQLTGAFPADDVRFTLTLAGQSLNFTTMVAGDVLTSVTTLSPTTVGLLELTCTATVATAARTTQSAAEPPALWLQLRDADSGVLAEGPHSQLELPLVANREDNGRRFGCRASLDINDTTVTKDVDTQLSVLYMPELAASDCPGNRTWLRGTWEALSCHATGNPAPTVVCGRDGITVSTRVPELVTRSRAGTYLCNATNSLGTQSRLITVRVDRAGDVAMLEMLLFLHPLTITHTHHHSAPIPLATMSLQTSQAWQSLGAQHRGFGSRGHQRSWSVQPLATPSPMSPVPSLGTATTPRR
uniref:Ig-like domain-containing protein n=1 Tax=Amazona collaria TaxID=241587 RepID=A0A8B9G8Y5_9PSIT